MNKSESKYFHTARRMDEALLSLLLEKDFGYITVKDVCARAGVNRSTFYLHYENTADLLVETLGLVHERFQICFPDPETTNAAVAALPKEDLFFMTDRWLIPYLELVKENRHIYKAIHTQMDIFDVERSYKQLFDTLFSPILTRYGVDKGKHGYIMEFYRYGLVAVLMKWVAADCGESPAEIAQVIKLIAGYALDGQGE